jgi:hypothetical protein|tara:strand:- start:377 stop:1252 length:876 start_codon:yes stop_codon:yes gene_type:complete
MLPQYDHQIINSFYLWTEDRLARVGEASVTGISQSFVYSSLGTDVPANMYAYYSNDRQFLTIGEGTVEGEAIPSGIYIDGAFNPQSYTNTTGVIIDNYNGRVLVSSNVGKTATISGNFPRKEINTYITQHDEEELLLNQEFVVNGTSFLESTSQMGWDRYTIPAVFITQAQSDNQPFAIGGTDQTINNLTMVVITDNSYLLNGTMSLFKDTKTLQFPLLGAFNTPYGGFFDIKSIPYTYTGYTTGDQEYVRIDDVKTSVFKAGGRTLESLKGKYVGFVDFKLSSIRNPRIC